MAQPQAPERSPSGYPRMTYEEFLALPDDLHAEWVDGEVVLMTGVSSEHNEITAFLISLLRFQADASARVCHEPMQMKTGPGLPGRSPDIFLLLNAHLDRVRANYVEGPGDLVIEVLSPGGEVRDHTEKFYEYQEGGVAEYWLIDPMRKQAAFWVRSEAGLFEPLVPVDGVLRSAVIPGVQVRVAWFWERPLMRDALRELPTD